MLSVNQESRTEVRKTYILLFATQHLRNALINPDIDVCYIRFTQCRIRCGCLNILDDISQGVKDTLKHLAISNKIWSREETRNLNQLLPFTKLENLTRGSTCSGGYARSRYRKWPRVSYFFFVVLLELRDTEGTFGFEPLFHAA